MAGPGSGKTLVLVERFASLVESGVEPARILAITFTEKAATQIKERVVQRFKVRPDIRRAVERSPVSTIHGLCHALLSEHAVSAGLDPQFDVLDELGASLEQAAAMDRTLDAFAINRRSEFLEFASCWKSENMANDLLLLWPRLLGAGGPAHALSRLPECEPEASARKFAGELLALLATPIKHTEGTRRREAAAREWIGRLETEPIVAWSRSLPFDGRPGAKGDPIKQALESLRESLRAVRREAIGAARRHLLPFVRDLFLLFEEEYSRRKRALAVLDFDDLETRALALLDGDEAIREHVRQRFDAVLMDELQDTNPIQWRIVDRIRRPASFFAVGDLNQSIFGFRGADPRLFARFQDSVASGGGRIDVLTHNYRSRQAILDAATAVQTPAARGVTEHKLTAARPLAESGEPPVELLIAADDADEILWTARRLRELYGTLLLGEEEKRRPARFSDMAILARSSSPFVRIQDALARFGIPFKVERGSNFFDEPAIVDLVNLLLVLDQPDNDIALFGVLRSPLFGVTDEEIACLRLDGKLAPDSAARRLRSLRLELADASPQPVLARFLDETGYLTRLKPQAQADIVKFFVLLDELSQQDPGDLREWLGHIGRLRAGGEVTTAPILEAGDAVTILSIHKAKGLEFPIVAVVNLQSPPRADTAPIAFRPESGLGLRWRDPADGTDGIDDAVLHAVRELDSRQDESEEDRLLYVAMTRAEEKLLLCWRDKTKGARSDWVRMISTGLQSAIESAQVSVIQCSGEPELLPPPDLLRPEAPPPLIPLPEPTPEAGAVAVTALAVFEACPWRYYLQFLTGWPQPAPELDLAADSTQPGGASFGTEVHQALAGLPAGQAALDLAANFTASDLGRRAASAPRRFDEFDFLVELDGRLLRGAIDLWFEDASGVVLVDYKTDRSLDEARLAQYSRQLRFYALALEKLNGAVPDEAWLFDLRRSKPHRVSLAAPDLEDCRTRWARFHSMRSSLDFPTRPGAQCQYCPYSAWTCPAAPQS